MTQYVKFLQSHQQITQITKTLELVKNVFVQLKFQ